jgi:Na+/H+ antiporter NhaD/arsenite permease-like protein
VSTVVNNVPLTIALIPMVAGVGDLGVPTSPLWWALALGAGLGGNATIMGATPNMVAVALSQKTRVPITSRLWMRAGLPVMIVTCFVATVLFVVFFDWMKTP